MHQFSSPAFAFMYNLATIDLIDPGALCVQYRAFVGNIMIDFFVLKFSGYNSSIKKSISIPGGSRAR